MRCLGALRSLTLAVAHGEEDLGALEREGLIGVVGLTWRFSAQGNYPCA